MNKYITETKIYDKNGNLLNTVNENFVSGKSSIVTKKFYNNVSAWLTNPNQLQLDKFTKKAIDLSFPDKISRINDSELKYIYNFLANHWNSGDKFVITARSTLDTCTSCQGYLVYLQRLQRSMGKVLLLR
ncbi:hypothetical protein BBI01_17065 [Chryseobacterium artocarpi]|uniref:Uncharacterized protein n=1 Tax=Chryseobacterium artocarpi TaxID=1414727 RepID=A0A1B8ZBC7_9FLAO|nr:hypothetical protein [Chryseobacterium artocarpi]OCA68928.1 hypothetical protein BBI01_17065 [Chryseobacterium artocarpi]